MRRALLLAALGAAGCVALACSRAERGRGAQEELRGSAVWFADGIGEGDAGLEETLLSFRCAAAFVAARRLTGGSAGWAGSDLPAPPRPLSRVPVVLVIEAPADPLAGASEERQGTFGPFLAREIASALARAAEFGPVRGVHLDVPFTAATVEPLGAAVREARSLLANELSREGDAPSGARGLPLTLSLKGRPPSDEKETDALRALASRTDGIVAFVFGGDNAADPAFTDTLGKPWWSAYDSRTFGTIRGGSEAPLARAPESILDRLTEDPGAELRHELPWNVAGGAGFSLKASRPLRIGAFSLSAGDSVVFSQPSLGDLALRVRARTTGRLARGRVVVFGETSDAARVFPVAALGDVLSGRPAGPAIRSFVEAGNGSRVLSIGGENASPHASAVSRVENWIEVDLAPARVGDVLPGGFDRWETYDGEGRPVSPGRASRLRLYETFVAPFERFEPARVRVRGSVPSGCCPVRVRVVPASGGEVETAWARPGAPPAAPSPSP